MDHFSMIAIYPNWLTFRITNSVQLWLAPSFLVSVSLADVFSADEKVSATGKYIGLEDEESPRKW